MATSLGEELDRLPGEGEIAGPAAVAAAAPLVDAADELRVEADACREREPPAVGATERDPARSRREEMPRRGGRFQRHPEGPGDHVRPPPGKDADDRIWSEPVQHRV